MLILYQGVEYSRHQEVGNTASGIAKASGQRIGCSNNVFVKEPCGPDLARYEAATENPNEEAESHQFLGVVDGPSESCRDRADEEASRESVSRSEAIARWSSY